MPRIDEEFLLHLLAACAAFEPAPLYPARFVKQANVPRDQLDAGLDELRRRGLVHFTEWVKDGGQGYAVTELGRQAVKEKRLPTARAAHPHEEEPTIDPFNSYDRGEIARRGVFAPANPVVTWVLVSANLLYFAYGALVASQLGLSVDDYLTGNWKTTSVVLIRLGALHPLLVFANPQGNGRPEFERLILFNFLHFGLLHLGMNMYFLWALGRQIEGMWGAARYLAIYAVSGIVSGCVVLLMNTDGLTAGASGCCFGIFAAMVVWFSLNKQYLPDRLIQEWSRNLGINVVLLVCINFIPHVSWQGHFGGAVGGLLTALLLHVQQFHPAPAVRWLALLGVPLIPLGFFLAVLWQAGWF